MTARKTGNPLFDIFWDEYPPRGGRKTTKKDSLEWFKKRNPSEEEVYDMVSWLKKDAANRKALKSSGQFCPEPKDAIRFLRNECWKYDEIGDVVTDSQRYEKKRSESIRNNTIKYNIDYWSKFIDEWTPGKLKANKSFMAASQYSEFAQWALERKPSLKGAKADEPQERKEPKQEEPVNDNQVISVTIDKADMSDRKQKIQQYYNDVVKYKEKTMPLI